MEREERMKREYKKGFLAEIFEEPQPYPEVATYIQELHDDLWRVVRSQFPWAQGSLGDYVEIAIKQLEHKSNESL